jgi:hypothetical protein
MDFFKTEILTTEVISVELEEQDEDEHRYTIFFL